MGGGTTDGEEELASGDKGELSLSLMLGLRFLRAGRAGGGRAQQRRLTWGSVSETYTHRHVVRGPGSG